MFDKTFEINGKKLRLVEIAQLPIADIERSTDISTLKGVEETLTLHKLGQFKKLGRSLKATNCIEA
jgi:hypothetical protein